MKSQGDIIITDPCYIIKEINSEDWDKCDFGDNMEVLGINHYISESTIYGDWSCTTWDLGNKDPKKFADDLCDFYIEMERTKGLHGKLSQEYKNKLEELDSKFSNLKVLGKFCADAGLVAVFLLDEVLKYNPDFRYHINKPWTTTLIKDFDGEVEYYLDEGTSAHILGVGNVNFCTTQTGY